MPLKQRTWLLFLFGLGLEFFCKWKLIKLELKVPVELHLALGWIWSSSCDRVQHWLNEMSCDIVTSLLLVLEVPPVPFGWVIAAVRHGLIESRLDSMDSGQLMEKYTVIAITTKWFLYTQWCHANNSHHSGADDCSQIWSLIHHSCYDVVIG